MSAQNTPGSGPARVGQRIDEAIELIEMELRHAIAYVNDAVIPQVRRESISAMRVAADTLRSLADRFEQASSPTPNRPSNQSPNQEKNENREPRT
jgi:hypothetical protein